MKVISNKDNYEQPKAGIVILNCNGVLCVSGFGTDNASEEDDENEYNNIY